MNEIKLKPCPFCGHQPTFGESTFTRNRHFFYCNNKECHVTVETLGLCEGQYIESAHYDTKIIDGKEYKRKRSDEEIIDAYFHLEATKWNKRYGDES